MFHPSTGAQDLDGQCGTQPRSDQACARSTGGQADVNFIKRVLAGPDDRVAIQDGHVVRNGKRRPEAFAKPCGGGPGCNLPRPITVPPDHWFMMGDNRGASDDSRFWGPVPTDSIVGRAFFRYWPSGRAGGL